MDASVIIVSWNAKAYLTECLDSIIKELEGNACEIITVDNASTDGSPDEVRARFPQVDLVVNETNQGFARANNTGIRRSSGRYIFLINSDVKVLYGCMASIIRYLDANQDIGILGPKILNKDLSLQKSCRKSPTLLLSLLSALGVDSTHMPQGETREAQVLSGCFLAVRREAMESVGLLDERFFFYAEDTDWCKRFRDAGWKAVYFTGASAIHYGGSSSARAPFKFYVEMQRANLQYWEKHHGPFSKSAYMMIIVLHQLLRVARGAALYALKPSSRDEAAFKIKRSIVCLRWILLQATGLNTELA